jgi:hypothetical protein
VPGDTQVNSSMPFQAPDERRNRQIRIHRKGACTPTALLPSATVVPCSHKRRTAGLDAPVFGVLSG